MCTNNFNKKLKLKELAFYFNNFYFDLLKNKTKIKPLLVTTHSHTHTIGLITTEIEEQLLKNPHFKSTPVAMEFTAANKTVAMEELLREWRESGDFLALRGWRDEKFEVKPNSGYSCDGNEPLFLMERSATCLFGVRQWGVDINGYVRHPEKGLLLWLQKRAPTKQTWPGRVDNMVGGGLASGFSPLQTAIKEAQEEASIPAECLVNLVPCGTVSFFFQSERGLFPNTEFVYDLELPLDFLPVNQDGEVESFELVGVETALQHCLSPQFKTTSCPVTLDFLVRHGVLNAESAPHLPLLLPLLHVDLNNFYPSVPIT